MPKPIELAVDGLPPAKAEALSMLGAAHKHAPRVLALLEAAKRAIEAGARPLGDVPVGLELALHCRRDRNRSDATNYLGGNADVLEGKSHRVGAIDHLGELAAVHLYDNDRQIERISFAWHDAERPSYRLILSGLKS